MALSRKFSNQVQELIKRPSNVLESLSRMLQRECKSKDVFVEDNFIPFFLYLTKFPGNDETSYKPGKPEDIFPNMKIFVREKGIELAMHKTVSLNTLKLQYYTIRACFDLELIWQRNCKEVRKKSCGALKQVLKINAKTIESRERLLKRITTVVAIDNGLGDDYVETEGAVKSVLSPGDLCAFGQLNRKDKRDVLEDLKVIVCGMRLFNNDAGHEQGKIVDLTLLIERSFDNTRLMLEYEQELSYAHVQEVTEKILSSGLLNYPAMDIPDYVDLNQVNYLKDISVFVHQRYQIISSILSKLMDQKKEIFETINGHRKTLKDIHAILIYKTAVNTKDIYPKFKLLGFIWTKLQQFVYFLSEINIFLDKLHSLDPVGEYLKDINIIIKKQEGEERTIAGRIKTSSPIKSKNHTNTTTSCENDNYCAWALSLGFILPVEDDKSHVLNYNNRSYSFNSEDALKRFRGDQDKSLLDIVRVMYDRPELMIFLDRHEEFTHLIRIQKEKYRNAFYGSKDMTCQTERRDDSSSAKVNAVQEIQLLRKKGFKLANQVNYANNTTQTVGHYHDRCCMGTQTKDLRSRSSQTAAEKEIQTEQL